VGGDGWSQTGPYLEDPVAAFRRAQEFELQRDDHGFGSRNIAELWEDEDWREYILTGGTGTVLDQWRLIGADQADDVAMMRPLTDREVRVWAPAGSPSRAEWLEALESGLLEYPGRGCGRCTVLYRGGRPSEIGYWGVTAD
jgi:hypothetical protein